MKIIYLYFYRYIFIYTYNYLNNKKNEITSNFMITRILKNLW